MKRVALYVRVSTEEQKKHGLSVDNQIDALTQYCVEKGYSIYKVYNDAGHSAAKNYKTRPALTELLQDADNKQFEMVLFTRLDRWFRSVPDYYAVQEILGRNNIPWRAIWEDYETETSSGQFKVNIMLSIAQAEAQRTSEKIKSVFEYKMAQGHVVGSAPLGYKKVGNTLVFDTDKQEGVKAFFENYLITFSRTKAVDASRKKGVTISATQVAKIFANPTYSGRTAQGVEVPAYITEEERELILSSIKKRARGSKEFTYIFSGLLRCENCGYRLAGKSVKRPTVTGDKSVVKTYQCTGRGMHVCDCKGSYANEKKLELFLLNNLEELLAQYKIECQMKANNTDVKSIKAKIKATKSKLERIGDRYEDGDIDKDTYKKKRADALTEISRLEAQVKAVEPTRQTEMPDNWKDMYLSLSEENKRSFWMNTFDHIEISPDRSKQPTIFF